ncbi:Hypothetical_protein [Hexamita inflata]|uniref:Hypothetical_protein n=1 Tax=Hexamita inflata TaxID=28002 RepID=A0AA86QS80_9EUKA|nr:Hypothetical protein HINF_LOCUS49737 [Hexamita inflata]
MNPFTFGNVECSTNESEFQVSELSHQPTKPFQSMNQSAKNTLISHQQEKLLQNYQVQKDQLTSLKSQLDLERKIHADLQTQYVKLKQNAKSKSENIQNLMNELKKKDQEICLLKLQNKTKKPVKYDCIEADAQKLCIECLFDIQMLIRQTQQIK